MSGLKDRELLYSMFVFFNRNITCIFIEGVHVKRPLNGRILVWSPASAACYRVLRQHKKYQTINSSHLPAHQCVSVK